MTDLLAALNLVGAAIVEPITEPTSRTWWPGLLSAGLLAVLMAWQRERPTSPVGALREATRRALHPSSQLDLQILLTRQLLTVFGLIPSLASALWIATHLALLLDAHLGRPEPTLTPAGLAGATMAASVVLFVAGDASRFLVHLALHRVPRLWQLHQVHHSAEVLTPITYFRVHPIEAMLFEARGAMVTGIIAGSFYWLVRAPLVPATLLGVHALGLLANVATGNLRHGHTWLSFGPVIERWLISPAQHQLHHGEGTDDRNLGTWLAIWDRMTGTWTPAGASPPERFGLSAGQRNHAPDDLVGALIGPVRAMVRGLAVDERDPAMRPRPGHDEPRHPAR